MLECFGGVSTEQVTLEVNKWAHLFKAGRNPPRLDTPLTAWTSVTCSWEMHVLLPSHAMPSDLPLASTSASPATAL